MDTKLKQNHMHAHSRTCTYPYTHTCAYLVKFVNVHSCVCACVRESMYCFCYIGIYMHGDLMTQWSADMVVQWTSFGGPMTWWSSNMVVQWYGGTLSLIQQCGPLTWWSTNAVVYWHWDYRVDPRILSTVIMSCSVYTNWIYSLIYIGVVFNFRCLFKSDIFKCKAA